MSPRAHVSYACQNIIGKTGFCHDSVSPLFVCIQHWFQHSSLGEVSLEINAFFCFDSWSVLRATKTRNKCYHLWHTSWALCFGLSTLYFSSLNLRRKDAHADTLFKFLSFRIVLLLSSRFRNTFCFSMIEFELMLWSVILL